MIKSIETTGRTEDAALSAALKQLGKTRDEVTVEVLERARSGFLGIGASPARIRVSYEEPDSVTQKLEKFLTGLFQRMGATASMTIELDEETNVISVNVSGEKLGMLIGRRGETLDAIQHIANCVVNSSPDDKIRVNIDVENYRAKRADALTKLALKVAGKVTRTRRSITLEPMNAYERHVIHTTLQGYEHISTYSTGSEPNRRVIIAYERTSGGAGGKAKESRPPRGEQDRKPQPQDPPKDPDSREWH